MGTSITWHTINNTIAGLRAARNATLSSTASNNKRQVQGDLSDPPGSDAQVDYSAYIYWSDQNQAAFNEWQTDFDNEAANEGISNSYADYIVQNDDRVVCMTLTVSNYGNDLVSLWYFSETPGVECEALPDEVEGLMELRNTL